MKEETFCVRGDLLRWARPIQYYLGHEAILTSKSPLMAYWKEDDRSFFFFRQRKEATVQTFWPRTFWSLLSLLLCLLYRPTMYKEYTYLGFATEPTEELVWFEALLLVRDDARDPVHEARFGLLVKAHRVVRKHTGQQMSCRLLIHSLVHLCK